MLEAERSAARRWRSGSATVAAPNQRDGIWKAIGDEKARALVTVEFGPLQGSPIGELTARFDIVLGLTPRLWAGPFYEVDIAVIGAGGHGRAGGRRTPGDRKEIAVRDRRGAAKGSTSASTALVLFELDQPLTHLTRKIGRSRAVRAYWRSAAAVGYLGGRIVDLRLGCEFKERRPFPDPDFVVVHAAADLLALAARPTTAAAPTRAPRSIPT